VTKVKHKQTEHHRISNHSPIIRPLRTYSRDCFNFASFINASTYQSYPNDIGLIQAGIYEHS